MYRCDHDRTRRSRDSSSFRRPADRRWKFIRQYKDTSEAIMRSSRRVGKQNMLHGLEVSTCKTRLHAQGNVTFVIFVFFIVLFNLPVQQVISTRRRAGDSSSFGRWVERCWTLAYRRNDPSRATTRSNTELSRRWKKADWNFRRAKAYSTHS